MKLSVASLCELCGPLRLCVENSQRLCFRNSQRKDAKDRKARKAYDKKGTRSIRMASPSIRTFPLQIKFSLVQLNQSRQSFAHTHLMRGGPVMLRPTAVRCASNVSRFAHTHFVRSGYAAPDASRCRQATSTPTSHEVGMRENLTRTRKAFVLAQVLGSVYIRRSGFNGW
jgi:hypothetical protein